jgi:hypothetical protein
VQVPDVQVVSAEDIGRNGTVGNGSCGGLRMVVLVLVMLLRSRRSTSEERVAEAAKRINRMIGSSFLVFES